MVVEDAAPVAVEDLAGQVTRSVPYTIEYNILRVYVVRTRDGFAQFARPIHRGVVDEEGLFQMNHIRPTHCLF